MQTINFHKTECGVDFFINILNQDTVNYLQTDVHNTDYFEVAFFTKAEGKVSINNKTIDIHDNSIVFISAFQKRAWRMKHKELEFKTLIFREDFLNEFFADKFFTHKMLFFYQLNHELILDVSDSEMVRFNEFLAEIKTELVQTKKDSVHIIRSILYYLLQSINRRYAAANNLLIEKDDKNYAVQFKSLLEEHICKKKNIEDYTNLLNISRITLNKAVKEQYNVTATELLKQRLLAEIKDRLVYSNKTVSEISFDLNYAEPGHMMRFFKMQTGMTTSEYLESLSTI